MENLDIYDQETYKQLDELLKIIGEPRAGRIIFKSMLEKTMKDRSNADSLRFYFLYQILEKHGFIENSAMGVNDQEVGLVIFKPEGKRFLADGGFNGYLSRLAQKRQEQEHEKKISRELTELTLQDLKTRLDTIEKQYSEQRTFWKESAKTSRWQRWFFVLSLIATLLSVYAAFFKD